MLVGISIILNGYGVNKANADDTQKLGLSDFNLKNGAIITGMTTSGYYSGEAINKMIEFNMQKSSIDGRIHIVTFAYDENFWYGFHIFVGQRDSSQDGYLRFDAYADKIVDGVVLPLEYYFGKYDSDALKVGDNLKLSAKLIKEEGNGYEFDVLVNDKVILSSKTPYIESEGIDDFSSIAHGNKILIYPESTYLKIWETGSSEPETQDDWMDDSASVSKDMTLYDENKNNIHIYDIEDVIGVSASVNFGFGSTKTEDGNIELMREKGDTRPSILSITPRNVSDFLGNYGVRYRTKNNVVISNGEDNLEMDPVFKREVHKDGRIEIGLELNAQRGGSFISDLSSNIIYLRLDFTDSVSYIAEFFPNGMSGGGSVAINFELPEGYSSMEEFIPESSEYTVEYGQFFHLDNENKEKLVNYVLITNENGDSIYGHAEYGGSFIYSHSKIGGKLKFVSPPYICASKIEILSIDKEKSVMQEYVPAYEESGVMTNYDIAEIIPIGQEGITYTTKSETNRRSIINVGKIPNDSKYEMLMKFEGDYSLRLAFFTDRADGKCATSGYHVLFTKESISLQSFFSGSVREEKTISNPIENGKKVKIEIRVAELFIMGVPEGQRVCLYIDGLEVTSFDFGKQSEVSYRGFDGILSGAGSVTIYPLSTTIDKDNGLAVEVDSNKINIGKRLKLDFSVEKPTLTDKISYEIVKGSDYAKITYNEKNETWYVTGEKDGKITIVAKIENEYGEFVSDEFEITIGTGIAEKESKGCKSYYNVSFLTVALISIFAIAITKKKKMES